MGVQWERRGVRPEASLGKSPEEAVRFEVEGGSLAFGFGPAFAEPANVSDFLKASFLSKK